MDTIFARTTANGRAGVAVIRISGSQSFEAAERLCRSLPASRGVRKLFGADGELIDECLVLSFPGGASFTGEPSVELQLHGSLAIVSAVLGELSEQEGLREAEAGEFTRRALDNGKLDLAQVEGLADLIDAETEAQRRQAMRVFEGGLGFKAEGWRKALIRAAALLEATIDFVDEDVPVDVYPEVKELLLSVDAELHDEIAGFYLAERVREGFEIAIVGRPNVGKSTLLNRLVNRDAAITSDIAGTTRDVIEVNMDLDGLPVTFIDTAGIRTSNDTIEQLGIERALKRAQTSDLRVFIIENNDLPEIDVRDGDIVRRAKVDVTSGDQPGISGLTGEGLEELLAEISGTLRDRVSSVGVAIRERHRIAMARCSEQIAVVQQEITSDAPTDLLAHEIQTAIRHVDSIVGRVDVEDLLDEIFGSFCIGK
ncbi:tRNA uridine-5-carboxymethylaminomethyl(34) synthesis GTPase MnmE [Cognatiyoonia sp.]|uniref:tRNA uridine-5-carboxymethylaminomethyl(34) synthesis GTPase MnmE n=1 Tax=Cognatiyoonia sp. TaxID=2211652 RepID=UPI003F6A10DB